MTLLDFGHIYPAAVRFDHLGHVWWEDVTVLTPLRLYLAGIPAVPAGLRGHVSAIRIVNQYAIHFEC